MLAVVAGKIGYVGEEIVVGFPSSDIAITFPGPSELSPGLNSKRYFAVFRSF